MPLYVNSGFNSLGITADGDLMTGRPGLFVRVKASSGKEWSAYEMNTLAQSDSYSNLYSRAFGSAVTFTSAGNALVIDNGVITSFSPVSAGSSVSIPANGYVMFMGSGFMGTSYFQQPTVGESVTIEPYLLSPDAEGFQIENIQQLVSGRPPPGAGRGHLYRLEGGFTEERFTTLTSPRSAIGIGADGKLILVCVPGGAKILADAGAHAGPGLHRRHQPGRRRLLRHVLQRPVHRHPRPGAHYHHPGVCGSVMLPARGSTCIRKDRPGLRPGRSLRISKEKITVLPARGLHGFFTAGRPGAAPAGTPAAASRPAAPP